MIVGRSTSRTRNARACTSPNISNAITTGHPQPYLQPLSAGDQVSLSANFNFCFIKTLLRLRIMDYGEVDPTVSTAPSFYIITLIF